MAIDTNNVGNTLFGNLKGKAKSQPQSKPKKEKAATKTEEKPVQKETPSLPVEEKKAAPKWETLLKVNVLMSCEEKDFLDQFARKIMFHRGKKQGDRKRERITSNTLIRAMITNLQEAVDASPEINYDMQNEEEVIEYLKSIQGNKIIKQ